MEELIRQLSNRINEGDIIYSDNGKFIGYKKYGSSDDFELVLNSLKTIMEALNEQSKG